MASVEVLQTTRLTPLVALGRAAADAGSGSAFLPAAVRETARMLGARACEVWLDEEGSPALAARHRVPETSPRALEKVALAQALAGETMQADSWLCVPLPGGPQPVGVLAVEREGAWPADDLLLLELSAIIIGLALQAAGADRFDAEARDQFLALVGHDLRSPLSNVRVGAQLAVRNLEAGDLVSVRAALAIIENQSARLVARLEALLDAVAADGRRLIRLEPLDLLAMAEVAVAPLRLAAEQSGAGTTFLVHGEPGVPPARGDSVQIGQVLEQLLDNAAKYAAGGRVTVSVAGTGTSVRVDVCDDGPGIRPEDVDRVFAPFGRGHAAAGKEGYGLGLYLARNIISAHGGRLWIARTSRSGTCMAFALPVAVHEDG
jgi:signal transduction histidine kinase